MKFIVTILCGLTLTLAAMGQQVSKTVKLSGKALDSLSRKSLALASVSLKDETNKRLKSTTTAPDGSFVFNNIAAGRYTLQISLLNYQTKEFPLTVPGNNNLIETYLMSASATKQLSTVTVTAQRQLVKQEIDRIAYDVKADPDHKVTNVLEMMRKVPLLSVDADDNIQLQGNSNYRILINGKPSGMMERNPKDILKSMPSSTIEKIEVITTPPAKYDGEGLAGIINIITAKKIDNGTNGTVNFNHRFPVGGPGIGTSFTAKSGKFGIISNAGGNLSSTPFLLNTRSRFTLGANPTQLWQSGESDYAGKSGYGGAELSYEIDSLNLISAQINYNANQNESSNSQISILKNQTSTLQRYESLNDAIGSGDGIDAAFNYQLGFKKDKNRFLTFSVRYYGFSNDQFNQVDMFNTLAYSQPNYQQNNLGKSQETTAQIDYVYPFKKIIIEAGAKAIFRNNRSQFDFLNQSLDGLYQTDPLRTNGFENQQNVYSIYNTYQLSLKKWGIKGGLRLEKTEITANFFPQSAFQSSSLNLIPSISINRTLKSASINVGFSSRIQRPGINQLNPFVDRSNPNFESSGNPNLKPMLGHNVEVNFNSFKKLSLNVGLRGMFIENLIMPRVVVDPLSGITRSSFGNTGNASVMGASLNVNYPISNKMRFSLNGMAGYGQVKGEIAGVLIETKGWMRRASSSLTYKPSKTWQASATLNYQGPNLTLQGTSNTFVNSSFSLNKDLMNNKLSIGLAANNAFNKYRKAINYTNGPDFTQESYNQNYQRNFTASINYRFGKLKESIKRNRKGIVNGDVSQGSGI